MGERQGICDLQHKIPLFTSIGSLAGVDEIESSITVLTLAGLITAAKTRKRKCASANIAWSGVVRRDGRAGVGVRYFGLAPARLHPWS